MREESQVGDIDGAKQSGSDGPLGIEGLAFEGGFVSISEDEWQKRFPLVLNPNGDEVWDYGDSASEHLLDAQDQECVWTSHHDSGDGTGDYIMSGRWRVNRMGYYVSTVPVPEGLRIQAWDDPFPPEDIEFLRSAVVEWQQLAGVSEDAIAVEDFEQWWRAKYPRRDEIERQGYHDKLTDMGIEEFFDNLDRYRSKREMPEPGKLEPELTPFAVHVEEFLENGDTFWRLPESSMASAEIAGLLNRTIGRLGVGDRVWTKVGSRDRVWLSRERVRDGFTSMNFMREESGWPRTDDVPTVEVETYDDGHWLAECREVADWFLESRRPSVEVRLTELGTRFPQFLNRRSAYAELICAEEVDGGVKLTRTVDWTAP